MKLGIGTYAYGWSFEMNPDTGVPFMSELDLIKKAVDFDLRLLQIGDNLPLHSLDESRMKLFETKLKQENIRIEIGARGLTHSHLSRYIRLCNRFDAAILRFIIDDNDYKPAIGEVVDTINAFVHELEAGNISLVIENHDRLKARDYANIIKQVNSRYVGICLDTVNSMGAAEGLETISETLVPYTLNLHIKDFAISRLPHKQGFVIDGRIAGQGMLDVGKLLGKLRRTGKCNTAILEQWVPFENNICETVNKEQAWAAESVKYLKRLFN